MKSKTDIHPDSKLAEIIISHPYVILMLEHFEISLPVQDLTISQICEKYNINEALFIAFTNLYCNKKGIPLLKLTANDAMTITRFLAASHRYYSEQIYPEITQAIEQMSQQNNHREMKLVSVFFADYFKEVTTHLDYENQIFHPYVDYLVARDKGMACEENHVDYSVSQYQDHHDDIEMKLTDLKNLLIKYLPAHNDRLIRRKLLFLLSEVEFDLKIHSEIEELILIPLAIKLENKTKAACK